MTSSATSNSNPAAKGGQKLKVFLALGGGLLLAMALVVGALLSRFGLFEPPPKRQESTSTREQDQLVVTPVSSSRYKNTHPDVQYVGSEACRSCHEAACDSYFHTGMGRSMAEVDLSREPPDGAYDHPLSKSRYEVRRRNGQMWHRELLLTEGEQEVVLNEFPVKYVVGSGRHSLTYLVEDDGFLVESPITWYTSRQAWGMSPGYDAQRHSGFQREVGESCLICHASQMQTLEKSMHRMKITEATIGCERCHGPGELHVARHSGAGPSKRTSDANSSSEPRPAAGKLDGELDDTIVNPARLPRDLAEAVCQQCHLRPSATVLALGRKLADFRPGLPRQAFWQDYSLSVASGEMTVVGHSDQMHQSRCFQKSDTFSCLTCHNPHHEPAPEKRTDHYNGICKSCHQPEACRVSSERRQTESPQNDCVQCHMPTSETDIPHLAFTHHRVAVHDRLDSTRKAETESKSPGELVPFLDSSFATQIERLRSLGLAYLEVASKEENPVHRSHYQKQALSFLSDAVSGEIPDSGTYVALARLRFELGMENPAQSAEIALLDPALEGQDLCHALFLVADSHFREKDYAAAISTLQPLGRLRRHSVHWLLMADCQNRLGNRSGEESALRMAVRIDPRLRNAHQRLATLLRERGEVERAEYHQRRAAP